MNQKPSLLKHLLEHDTLPFHLEDYDARAVQDIATDSYSRGGTCQLNALFYLVLKEKRQSIGDKEINYLLRNSDLNLFYRGGNILTNVFLFNKDRNLNLNPEQLDYLIRHTDLNHVKMKSAAIQYALGYNKINDLNLSAEQFQYMFDNTQLDIHNKTQMAMSVLLFLVDNYEEQSIVFNNATWARVANIYLNSFKEITSIPEYAVITQFTKAPVLFEKVWPYINDKDVIAEVLKRKSEKLLQHMSNYIEKNQLESLIDKSNKCNNLHKI